MKRQDCSFGFAIWWPNSFMTSSSSFWCATEAGRKAYSRLFRPRQAIGFSILAPAVRRLPFHSLFAIRKQLSSEWIQARGPSKRRDGQSCERNFRTFPCALHFRESFHL